MTTHSATTSTIGNSAVEIATITPVYAAVRAHRPLKNRMGSKNALLGSTVMAGAFGLLAAEATAQQYNLPGSGGFTDVSSSINVVTDAGGGNIRVILADGVQFVAGPGQYQLNPATNNLSVSTDVLLGAYTGGAPVAAAQTNQFAQAAFTPPPVYPANAPLTLPRDGSFAAPQAAITYQPQVFTAGQYATQPSVVGGYQMQPSQANIAYNPPATPNLNPQPTQYVPAYSAGNQFATTQVTTYQQPASTFGGAQAYTATQYSAPSTFGTTTSTFGGGAPTAFAGATPIPVTQAVPTAEVAITPEATGGGLGGGLFGLPCGPSLACGALVAGGIALAAMSGGGTTDTSSSGSTTNSSFANTAGLDTNDPAVREALGLPPLTTTTTTTTSSGRDHDHRQRRYDHVSDDGITVTNGSSGGTTTTSTGTSSGSSGASATISAGSEDQDIAGTSGDDTVTFDAAEDAEEFNSLDLGAGDDTVILKDMDDDLEPKDLNNVENVTVEVSTAAKTLDMGTAGDDIETLTVDADGNTVTVTNVDSIDKVAITDAGDDLVTIEDVDSGNTVALTESDNVKITSGSVLTLTVNEVNTAVEIENVTDLTINATDGSDNNFALTATDLEDITVTGGGALTITNALGTGNLADVQTFDGSAGTGPINIVVDGTGVEDVDTGSAGDSLQIKGSHTDATYDTGAGNDNVEIDAFGADAVLNTGAGGDTIELDVALTSGDQKIDGGDATDTLEASAAITAGDYDNIEKLEIGGGAPTVDLALFDNALTAIEVESTSALNLENVREDVPIETVSGADITLVSGTDNSADIVAAGALTVANSSTGSVIDTLNLELNNSAASTVTLNGTATNVLSIDADNADVTIAGSAVSNTGASGITAIDASDSTANVTIIDGANGLGAISTITMGAGDDSVTIDDGSAGADIDMGAGDDTIDASANTVAMDYRGGAGEDTITLNANTVSDDIVFEAVGDFVTVTSGNPAAAVDVVNGFEAGTDTVNLDALNLTGLDGTAGSTAAAYTLVDNGTVDVAYHDDGTNTYVFVDLGGGDVGQITLNNAQLTDADFNL